jgi:SAM-dependent MidA family methyltransferase
VTTAAEAAIRAEIERRGAISFADFMGLALGHPDGGYYMAAAERPIRSGDFLTAPELHPIFGATLARQVEEAWDRLGRPVPFTLVEHGAGAGTLALAILAGLRADGSPLADHLRYVPVELSPHRRGVLRERATAAGLELVAGPTDSRPGPGFALANEYLDALPVHVLEASRGRLLEVLVGLDGSGDFVELRGDPSAPAVAAEAEALAGALEGAGVPLVDGQRVEVRPAVGGWAREVAARLTTGLVLVLDYGGAPERLFGPRRRAGTVMTYRGHSADGDPSAPYRDIGERDITAHVDTGALGRALRAAGLDVLGETSQAELLVGCGLEEVLRRAQAGATSIAEALELRAAVGRLLDPRQLGAFRAVLAGRGIASAPPLRGLTSVGPRRG